MQEGEQTNAEILELLRRHGWNSTSFQLLEPEISHWFHRPSLGAGRSEAIAGGVGYVDTGGAWVAAGAPLASAERLAETCQAFIAAARSQKRRVAFFAVEQRLLDAIDLDAVVVGEQPWWNPQLWPALRTGHRSLREQLRRARAKGVVVSLLDSERLSGVVSELRVEIERLLLRWSTTRPMPPMAFLVALHPFDFAQERLYFAARREGKLIGLLVAVPIYQRKGWFLEDLIRDPAAPNGTAELMVDAAMEHIRADGSDYATLGLAPLSGDVPWLRLARRWLSGFYNFEGLRAFKAKLQPHGWEPIYLAAPRGRSLTIALYDSLDAFASGHAVRFALRAIFRASPFVLRWLAYLLALWTVALASVPARRWFPSAAVRWSWVAFDLLVLGALLSLSRRWKQKLGLALAAAVSADALLTLGQAVVFNLPRRHTVIDLIVVLASIIAPIFAAGVLIGGVRRHLPRREAVR